MLFSTKENRMSDEEDTELDFTDPLRASIYSLAYMLKGNEKDLSDEVVELIEHMIYKERNEW